MRRPAQTQLFLGPADLENGQFTNGQPSPGKQAWVTVFRFLIAVEIGVVAALAWQAYGDAANKTIAPAKDITPDLGVMRQSIDAFATSTATNQTHMMRSIDQLAASQKQMTSEIARLQQIEHHVLSLNSDHPLQPVSAPVPKAVLRPSQVPTALTHAEPP